MIDKDTLEKLLSVYIDADNDITTMRDNFGVDIVNCSASSKENFYNKLNYIIFELFEELFTQDGVEIIENYLFDRDCSFEELWKKVEYKRK